MTTLICPDTKRPTRAKTHIDNHTLGHLLFVLNPFWTHVLNPFWNIMGFGHADARRSSASDCSCASDVWSTGESRDDQLVSETCIHQDVFVGNDCLIVRVLALNRLPCGSGCA